VTHEVTPNNYFLTRGVTISSALRRFQSLQLFQPLNLWDPVQNFNVVETQKALRLIEAA
jgi:hypothetical protein